MLNDKFITRKEFNNRIVNKTHEFQKKFGFNIGTGQHATWNNEADAFKHALMQAELSFRYNKPISHIIGDYHEMETFQSPNTERNMDLWNNAIGREVAEDIKRKYGKELSAYSADEFDELVAPKIMEKMKKGELITNPNDPRKYKNIRFELLNNNDRILYDGEFQKFDEKKKKRLKDNFINQIIDNNWKLPSRLELNKKVLQGDLMYIKDYIKTDGTKLHGYYPRRIK